MRDAQCKKNAAERMQRLRANKSQEEIETIVSKYNDDFGKLCRKLAKKYNGADPATAWWIPPAPCVLKLCLSGWV